MAVKNRAAAAALLLLSFTAPLRAQNIKLSSQEIDYGKHIAWDNPAGFIEIQNTGSRSMAVLRVDAPRGIWYDYPKTYIEPGRTAEITFIYYTEEAGSFALPVKIYVSLEPEPIQVMLKGNIRGFASNALTACPVWQKPESKPLEFDRSFLVLDDETGKPISMSLITIYQRGELLGVLKTGRNGTAQTSIPGGMYGSRVEAQGYIPVDSALSFRAGTQEIIYRLRKETLPEPILAEVPDTLPRQVPETPRKPEQVPVTVQPISADTSWKTDPLASNDVLPFNEYKSNNIVFLLDVSSSMNGPARMPLLKLALLELAGVLRRSDRVSFVTFSTQSKVVASNITGSDRDTVVSIINAIRGSGSTNGVKGLQTAYELARKNFIPDGNNTVLLATDGIFKMVDSDINGQKLVKDMQQEGITLSVMALGTSMDALKNLEAIAVEGGGTFTRIRDPAQAPQVLIQSVQQQSRRK
ncbi:MAG: VWA domain-containing protein [Bacteroidia bacterium]|nr:VWA domain-containing protein [Bacteroidia bacterium]